MTNRSISGMRSRQPIAGPSVFSVFSVSSVVNPPSAPSPCSLLSPNSHHSRTYAYRGAGGSRIAFFHSLGGRSFSSDICASKQNGLQPLRVPRFLQNLRLPTPVFTTTSLINVGPPTFLSVAGSDARSARALHSELSIMNFPRPPSNLTVAPDAWRRETRSPAVLAAVLDLCPADALSFLRVPLKGEAP
jgi:hypothetical protein